MDVIGLVTCIQRPQHKRERFRQQHNTTQRCIDISPGVHLQSPGLLQLSFVRRHRQITSMTAVSTERSRQVNHIDGSPWTHLTCSAWIALTPCGLQTGNTDVEVPTQLHTIVSLRRVQVSAWRQSPSPLVWRHHMHHTMVQYSPRRQVVWCRRTAALEQAACFTAVIWQSLTIQKTVENVLVCQGLGCGTLVTLAFRRRI